MMTMQHSTSWPAADSACAQRRRHGVCRSAEKLERRSTIRRSDNLGRAAKFFGWSGRFLPEARPARPSALVAETAEARSRVNVQQCCAITRDSVLLFSGSMSRVLV